MRNAKWINAEHSAADLEVEHPVYGWIPITARVSDPETEELFARVLGGEAGVVAEYSELPPPTPEKIQASLDAVVTDWIDSQAAGAGFKNAAYIVSYYDSTNPVWKAAARAFVPWRDGIWATCIAIVDAVKAGQRPIPTAAELLAELPTFSL